MKILSGLQKSKDFWVILISSVLFFFLRLPSLFEPYWYGDEGIYQVIGLALRNGRGLYTQIWDNKPPLLYYLYGLFSGDQSAIRLVSLIFGLLSVILFFFLSKRILKERKKYFLATFLYSFLFGLPLIEGNIANAENFMLFPIVAGGLLTFEIANAGTKKVKQRVYFLIGFLLSLAFLFKVVAIFDFAAFFLFLFFLNKEKSIFIFAKKIIPLILGFAAPIILVLFIFLLNGSLRDFIKAAFLQNVGYVGYGNKFLTPQGLLFIKLAFLALFSFFLFLKRKLISPENLFVFLWLAFSLFNAFFSQRPYTHYLLVLLPSLLLFLGVITFNKKFQKLGVLVFLSVTILLLYSFNLYGKTIVYYQNFASFILNKESVVSYFAFFDSQTPIDYDIAQYINQNSGKNDKVFIWGNDGQVYKLLNKLPPGRFIVYYHIQNSQSTLKETELAFYKQNPKFVVVTNPKQFIPFRFNNYRLKIIIGNSYIYERFI